MPASSEKTLPKTIRVRFDKHGMYHPSFGRMGRGDNKGKVYVLPGIFAEKETIKVPIMDRRTFPPQQIGEREITRYKHLPKSAEIIDDPEWEKAQKRAKVENGVPEKEFYPTLARGGDVYLKKMGIDPDEVEGKRGETRPKG